MELHNQSDELRATEDDSNSQQSSVAVDNGVADDHPPVAAVEPDDNETMSAVAAIPTKEENFVDAELIEKLLQEDTERVRCKGDASHGCGFRTSSQPTGINDSTGH